MSPSTLKALVACVFFAAAGVFGGFQVASFEAGSIPLFGFYAVLVVNTFFSIQTFSAITPNNVLQTIFDAVLVGIYCALALSFSGVPLFSGILTSLFLIAVAKYIHLDRLANAPELLNRKIKINALGALFSVSVFAMSIFWSPVAAAWTLCVVFSLANIYLLVINPMYRSGP